MIENFGDNVLEDKILGYLLINEQMIGMLDEIEENDFVFENNKKIIQIMKERYSKGEKTDYITILENTNVPESYLDKLIESVPGTVDIELSIQKLRKYTLYRKLYEINRISSELIKRKTDPYEISEYIEKNIRGINTVNNASYVTLSESFMTFDEEIRKKKNARLKNEFTGLTTGFKNLNKFVAGFEGGQLVIMAARPGAGKTSLALDIAFEQAKLNIPVAFFSLEMNHKQLRNKIASSVTQIEYSKIKDGYTSKDDDEKLAQVISVIADYPLFLGDTTDIDLTRFKSQVRKMKREHGIRALYIDYLQLMSKSEDKVKEIGNITRTFKLLAMELDIPIILLSQLSRKTEDRHDKRPMMSDLRDSGAIEQDADIIMFIYSDDYYEKSKEKECELTEIIFAKNREGSTGTAKLYFWKKFSYFVDAEANYDN